ncbi:hypothetical protein AFCA_004420 [Aspergillus flavus]|uniref:Bacteriophage T5 Orf172 DNA-binding domain-containing protein n=1 Tax=Aspergillus flavus TaxID=5059 RepID=A0AB74BSS6_ASPFL|nr:hypothetical protein G4B11_004186 [Aspergillus flavus]RMZ37423.1 hypothetical protein CA14_011513 [Aspergillus flavus]UDD56901.1 hypothetical protein AFCA_004420 [Aspergillus flavus]
MATSTSLRSDLHSDKDKPFSNLSPDLVGKFPDDESNFAASVLDDSPTRAVAARRQANQLLRQRLSSRVSISARDQTVEAYLREGTEESLNRNPQRSLLEHCSLRAKALSSSHPILGASQTSPTRPAWIPKNAEYIELSDDEPDDGIPSVATHTDVPTTTGHLQTNEQIPFSISANSAQTDSIDLSDHETPGSESPFSVVSQQETLRTDVCDDGLEQRQTEPERTSDACSTEDIILAIRDVICGWTRPQEKESKEGYAYIFYDRSAESLCYKIGHSGNVKVRTQQHQNQCQLRRWSSRKSPALREYKLLEKLAHAELRSLRCKFTCLCGVEHREYFLGKVEHGQAILDSWSRWLIEKNPYNDDGNLRPFWVDRFQVFLDGYSRFFHCTANEGNQHPLDSNACQACLRKGWQKFTEPTAQDIFEYDCRIKVPFAGGRLLLQACYSRFSCHRAKLVWMIDSIVFVCRMLDFASSVQVILLALLGKGLYLTVCSIWNHTVDVSRLPEFYLACAAAYRLFLLPTVSMDTVDQGLPQGVKRIAWPTRKSPRKNSKSPGMPTAASNQSQKTSKPTHKKRLLEKPSNIELFHDISNAKEEHGDDINEIIGRRLPDSPPTLDLDNAHQQRNDAIQRA